MLRRLLVGIVCVWPALAAAQGPSAAPPAPAAAAAAAVFSGVDRQLQVQPPRLEADIEVDGVLDEPVWQQAARLTGFSRYAPVDGGPADRATEVLVWYSPSALHFGVRATAAADGVQATLADRDKIDADDHVQFFLSTFGDGRQAFVFAVNPFGVQMDGAMVEGSRTGGGGFGGLAQGREDVDRSPDFVFQSRGHLEADGYVVEVRIPFKSLRYQAAADVSWGLHVTRVSPRAGVEESWAPARRDGASFLNQAGALVGMHDLRRGLVLDVNPVATAAVNGAPAASGASGWNYGWSRPDLGMNVRWGVTDTLTLNGTVNPDFSQVEADAGQFQFDPRQALFFPDKRPFFLDGIEQFATPNNLIYTRRIVAPLAATRLTGRVSKSTSVAYLMAVDDAATSATGRDHPVFNVLRAQRDIGTGSKVAFVYTDRIDGIRSNRVAAADTRVVWKDIYSLLLQGAAARTDSGDRSVLAPLWQATFNRAGRRYGLRMQSRGIDPDFQAQSGFISRRGVASINIANQLTTYGAPGAFVERFTSDVVVDGSWVYDDFVAGRPSQDRKLHFNQNLALRGGWRVGGSVLFETFGYDPTLFTDYVIARPTPTGTVYDPYVGTKRLPNRDYVFSFTVPTRKGLTADGLLLWGKDENFYEWSSADIVFANVGATWRPTDQLRIEGRYQLQSFQRRTDGSYVGIRRIPRLKVEYQVSRPIFVRVIAEQNGNFQDTLRDDSRTGFPIYRMDGAGGYVPAARESTRRLRLDWLFSYQPTPGTVFFAGYGTSLQELDDRRGRQPLRRISDGFFLKMSYLFRL